MGQRDAHGLQQPAFGFIHVPEGVACDRAHYPQINVVRRDPLSRLAKGQRGLGHSQHCFKPASAMEIFCPQIKCVLPRLRRKDAEIPRLQPVGRHVRGNHAHSGGSERQLRVSGYAGAFAVFHALLQISIDLRVSAVIPQADGRRDSRRAGAQPHRIVPPGLKIALHRPRKVAPQIGQFRVIYEPQPLTQQRIQNRVGVLYGHGYGCGHDHMGQIGRQRWLRLCVPYTGVGRFFHTGRHHPCLSEFLRAGNALLLTKLLHPS